jgi:hypothetical protein
MIGPLAISYIDRRFKRGCEVFGEREVAARTIVVSDWKLYATKHKIEIK